MRHRLAALLLCFTVCACGDSPSPAGSDDLATAGAGDDLARPADASQAGLDAGSGDLAAPDLTSLPDLGGPDYAGFTFCAATRVAATCVQEFFQPVAMCFAPAGGCRSAQNGDATSACWQPGTVYTTTYQQATGGSHLLWASAGATCLEGDVMPRKGKPPLFTVKAGGRTLIYDQDSGDVTCPDGTHAFIGGAFGDCGSLQAILQPDIKSCQPGMCP